jgi:hypothetical protein
MAIAPLDVLCPTLESWGNMNRTLISTLLVAAAALAGCNQSNADSNANEAQANVAEPIVLPPSIAASHAYRCKDNSLLYVDWYSDGTARVKTSRSEAGTSVPAADVPTTLKGDAQSGSITYGGQTCHV